MNERAQTSESVSGQRIQEDCVPFRASETSLSDALSPLRLVHHSSLPALLLKDRGGILLARLPAVSHRAENAGAQRGVLILLRGDEPRIEAEAISGRDAVTVNFRHAFPTQKLYCGRIEVNLDNLGAYPVVQPGGIQNFRSGRSWRSERSVKEETQFLNQEPYELVREIDYAYSWYLRRKSWEDARVN